MNLFKSFELKKVKFILVSYPNYIEYQKLLFLFELLICHF